MIEFTDINHLVEPDTIKDHPAQSLSETMQEKLDEALNMTLNELTHLSLTIEKYKSELTARAQVMKAAVRDHFDFTSEVIAFKDKALKRLEEVANGTPRQASAARAAQSPAGGDDVLAGSGGGVA